MNEAPDEFQRRLDGMTGPDRAVAWVDAALAEGVRRGASDIHFEPTPTCLAVRFRTDGVMQPGGALPREFAGNIAARLKVLSDLLTYRTDIPQEGSIRAESGPELRVSTFPTVHGEKVVVRVFQSVAPLQDVDQLGFDPAVLARLEGVLEERSGAVYLTGPSGSGKTTTIYACLNRLARAADGRHIVTIEDPVERVIPGVSQSQVRPGTEFDFARGLRSLLRQDPDIIMVGEIRDRETAAAAAEAALTGHLVFSTLHAGSAAGVVGRLLDMGVEPHVLTSGVRAILNQRLLRRVCAACVGAGCEGCGRTGYRGRLLVAELLIPDAAFRRGILARADTEALEAIAVGAGWQRLRQAAAAEVAAGRTTAAEVDRVLGPARSTE